MLKALKIKGYKCLRDVRLSLGNLNLLVGVNASGKSSAIQAVLLLRQSSGYRSEIKRLNLKGDLYEAGLATDILHPDANHSIEIEIFFQHSRSSRYSFSHDRSNQAAASARFLKAEGNSRKTLHAAISGEHFIYLNAERASPKASFELPPDAVSIAGVLGKHGEFTTAYLARASQQSLTIENGGQLVESLIQLAQELDGVDLKPALDAAQMRFDLVVNVILGWVIPGAAFTTNENPGTDSASLTFVRDRQKTRTTVRATHSGFGLTYVLPVIAAALAANPEGLVIIENPEAHLHPFSQSRIGAFLAIAASAERQILIETHSDHVINGVRLTVAKKKLANSRLKVHFFEPPEDGTTAKIQEVGCSSEGRLDPWPRGFFDQIERDLAQL